MPNLKPHCNRVIFWPQYRGTCWFNAVLISLFYSQYSRNLLYKISSKWDKRIEFYKMLRFVLKHKYLKSKNPEKDFKFFDVMKPENILRMIHELKPKYINPEIANGIRGYHSQIIISKLYKLLGVSNLMFELTKDDKLYYDRRNHVDITFDDYEEKAKSAQYIQNKFKELKNPEVILINVNTKTPTRSYKYIRIEKFYKKNPHYAVPYENNTLTSLDDTVIYNSEEYVLDSVVLNNWNDYQKRGDKKFKKLVNDTLIPGHAIAGITCDNQRYVYNGWSRYTKDIAKELQIDDDSSDNSVETNEPDIVDSRPCELMKFDWDTKINDEFCLNLKKCSLPFASKFLRENHMCFSFAQGNRILVYVRKNSVSRSSENQMITPEYVSYSDDKSHSSSHMLFKSSLESKAKNSPTSSNNSSFKDCNSDQIRNPATNRCIKKDTAEKLNLIKPDCPDGKIRNPATGRCISAKNVKQNDAKIAKKVVKECPEGKIRNPATGRCINVKHLKQNDKKVVKPIKECPPGKIRNPTTGRCIKIK